MILVSERPPVTLTLGIETPSGARYRLALDEAGEQAPSALTRSSIMPGGYENFSCQLARDPSKDYRDVERGSTITIYGAGGDERGEYRLEETPRTSGDQESITPTGLGFQAVLSDDREVVAVYVDADQSHWGAADLARQLQLAGLGVQSDQDYQWSVDSGALTFKGSAGSPILGGSSTEAWYSAPAGVRIAKMRYKAVESNVTDVDPAAVFPFSDSVTNDAAVYLTADDTLRTAVIPTARRYLVMQGRASADNTPTAGAPFSRAFKALSVYDDSGVPTYPLTAYDAYGVPTYPIPDGVKSPDIEAHAVGRWAPALNFTTGPNGTIRSDDDFIIPHLVQLDPGTVADLITASTRFSLRDWAVWERKRYYSNAYGARGRKWRARVAPSQLEETGPKMSRVWNRILVSYKETDGTTVLVGAPGSGADIEDSRLADYDPSNAANALGIIRCDLLQMGVSSRAGAIRTGQLFLQQSRLIDNSGRALIVGWVESDTGVLYPASKIRAGDQVSFIDAADSSHRRVAHEQYTHDNFTCAVDLDAPPDGLKALLERLGVVLVRLGLG